MLGDSWQKLVKVGSGLMWHVLFKFNSESIGGGEPYGQHGIRVRTTSD